jgi:hypothetical protein
MENISQAHVDDVARLLTPVKTREFNDMQNVYKCDGCNKESCPNVMLRMHHEGRCDWTQCTHCGKYLCGLNLVSGPKFFGG